MTDLSREYAEALFALAAETDREKEYLEALDTAAALLADNPEYVELLACPAIQKDERDGLLAQTFGQILPEQVLAFLQLLCAHGRIRSLNDCIEEYRLLYQTAVAMSTAEVTSAVPLTEDEMKRLSEALSARLGRTVTLTCTVDESLLGGMVVRVDGKVLDGSLRSRLHAVKEVMKQ